MFAAWRDEALALSDRADDTDGIELRETLCDFIENADLGIKLACVDRESFAGDWRAVYLEMFRVDPSSGSRVWRRLLRERPAGDYASPSCRLCSTP